MWKRLGEYDKQFQDIKSFKKDSKIMWGSIRKIICFNNKFVVKYI